MGRAKYTNFGVGFPVFSVGARGLHVRKEDGSRRDALVLVGGGGAAKSGIKNAVAVFSVEHNERGEPCVVQDVVFDCGERLCVSAECSADERLVAASLSDGCLLLGYDEEQRSLTELCFFATDFLESEVNPACQNVARFSPTDTRLLATGGDDATVCIWRLEETVEASVSGSPRSEEKGVEVVKGLPPAAAAAAAATEVKEQEEEEALQEELDENSTSESPKPSDMEVESDAAGEDGDAATTPGTPPQSPEAAAPAWKAILVHKLKGHSGEIRDLDFDPTGKLLVSASGDNTCRLWDVSTGKLVQLLPADTAAGMSYRRVRFAEQDRLLTLQSQMVRKGSSFIVEFVTKNGNESKTPWSLGKSTKLADKPMTTIQCHPPFVSIGDASGGLNLLDYTSLSKLGYFDEVHSLPITGLSTIPNPDDPEHTYIVTASMDKTVTMTPALRPAFSSWVRLIVPVLLIMLVVAVRVLLFSEDDEDPKEL
ncbi:Eukaryotic translation initiation factor 3 subunit I (eIF3i) (Eukaryotic translation initiation factor 3 39 kDa subunit homolog) (eIF-3 39 kDa subunit homolog) [Durusdinium trenchii]|uniref:Eukaryotic translation initiation factor 3 subunit I (eIF3i) (Eukaryotic translation initiation factor 3 39 kDa subunit homolog) (eIF-3 39 kDa subunit homolog) n=1 Tax=Durusdinium trenchii TaxID=1381693 RepID=A0ABP0JCB0_9DINO